MAPPSREELARIHSTNLRNIRAADCAGLKFEWEWDESPDLSWMDEEERSQEHEVLALLVRDRSGQVVASIGNVVDSDSGYRRELEAELAGEALDHMVPHSPGEEVAIFLAQLVFNGGVTAEMAYRALYANDELSMMALADYLMEHGSPIDTVDRLSLEETAQMIAQGDWE
jgi:hypothetical protein